MSLTVNKFYKDNKYLKLLNEVDDLKKEITEIDISRPGIELAGDFEFATPTRIQLLGYQEVSFMDKKKINIDILNKLISPKTPAIVFSRGLIPDSNFLEIATKKGVAVFLTEEKTSKVFNKLFEYLEFELAPEKLVHGVFMKIYGEGILIKGDSGIGKSEVALELIKKGHFLIADDAVEFKKIDSETLIGTSPKLLQNKMEIRGIGIVDIQKLYGVTSVQKNCQLDLIIELTYSNENIDRIGNNISCENILDTKKNKLKIPILKGKNISNLIEVAVANFQLKEYYNYDSSNEFINNLNDHLTNVNKDTDERN